MTPRSDLGVLREPLEERGFRKRSSGVFTVELARDVLGWLGLNTASRHQVDGTVEVNPVVGVRHQGVERLVAELRAEPFHPYLPPTISTSIGYVMPLHRYQAWAIASGGDGAPTAGLIDAVVIHGLPFMRQNADLESLYETAEEGLGFSLEYRLPVIRLLLGERQAARAALDKCINDLGARQDAAAQQFRAFSAALVERMAKA